MKYIVQVKKDSEWLRSHNPGMTKKGNLSSIDFASLKSAELEADCQQQYAGSEYRAIPMPEDGGKK